MFQVWLVPKVFSCIKTHVAHFEKIKTQRKQGHDNIITTIKNRTAGKFPLIINFLVTADFKNLSVQHIQIHSIQTFPGINNKAGYWLLFTSFPGIRRSKRTGRAAWGPRSRGLSKNVTISEMYCLISKGFSPIFVVNSFN